MSESFSDKLAFVLKALSLSRGRMAAELGLNKSVVGRWATGAVKPSAHNLSRLSGLVAQRIPGFTSLDWELDIKSLAALLGIERGGFSAANGFNLSGGLPLPLLAQTIAKTNIRGAAYEGFYRSTRPIASMPGQFAHDHCMVRKDPSGLLRLSQTTGGVFVDGWVLPLKDHLFIIGVEFNTASLVFAVLHDVEAVRVDVLDGLVLSVASDAGRTPATTPVVFERIGDLSGDKAADDARFAELAASQWLAAEGSIPDAMRRHLTRDTGDTQLALGGDWMLTLPLSRSVGRGAPQA